MIEKLFVFLIVFFVLTSIVAQTPEQSYFEWTSMPFSKEELDQRRSKLIEILQNQEIKGLVLIPAKDGFSNGETFRQLDDFYYFTGLELPNAILTIDVTTKSIVIYTPERDLRFENGSRLNDFPGRPFLDNTEIAAKSGVILKSIIELNKFIEATVQAKYPILVNSGRQGPISMFSDDYVTSYSPVQVLLHGIKSKHNGVNFENIYSSIALLRMIKSPAEIALLRRAVTITEQGFGSIIKSGPNSL